MGSITNKIFELLESGGHYEERRSTGIIISSNWFDAVDCGAGETTPKREGNKDVDSRIIQERRHQAINDIP